MARDIAGTALDAYDQIAPGALQTEADTAEEESVESESFIFFNPDRISEHRHYDIGIELSCSVSAAQVNTNENIFADNQY